MRKQSGGEEAVDPGVIRGHDWPCLRQFCVFLENRVGRLHELMRLLESLDVRVVSLSIVDSVDFAMCRLIFTNPDRARERLALSKFLFSESDVVGVVLPDTDQPLTSICIALLRAEVNIHQATPMMFRKRGQNCVAMYVDDVDAGGRSLREAGFELITEHDLLADDELS